MTEGDRPHADGVVEDTAPAEGTDPDGPAEQPAAGPEPEPQQEPQQEPVREHRGRLLRRTAEACVVLLLAVTAASYAFDLGDRTGLAAPDPVSEPQAVAPPPGLELPTAPAAQQVAAPLRGGRLDEAAIRRAVARLAADKRLGRQVAVVVAGTDGEPVYRSGPDVMMPASTMKTLTSLAALESVGPQHRFTTTVVRSGRTLTLVGGGDPLLERRPESGVYPERADVTTLAQQTAAALKGTTGRLRLTYDTSLFTGPSVNPRWEAEYIPTDVVSPIVPLWVDEGRDESGYGFRVDDPAAEAARVFRSALQQAGVRVGPARPGRAPEGADAVAEVRSAPLVEVVQHVLEASDNEGAEVLLRQVALAEGRDASFVGGVAAAREVLDGLGVRLNRLQMYDGSGLSRDDRINPVTLVDVLSHSLDPDRPELAGVASGLPVAGFSGSLTLRFDDRADAGLGRVRAKTGTLRGVHGLAGVAVGRDDSVMLFAVLTDRVKEPQVLFTRAQLDRITAALAGCRCGG